jgi:hypothetical protein
MAECPFCSAPLSTNDILRGKLKVCPRCAKPLALGGPVVKTAAPAPMPEYVPPPSHARSQPSPVQAAEPPEMETPAVPEREDEPRISPLQRLANLDGPTLAAFVLGSVGLFLASVPPWDMLAKVLALVALLLGLFASLLPALLSGRNPAFSLFVTALGLIVVLFLGRWPQLPARLPTGPMAVPLSAHAKTGPRPVKEDEWLDASEDALRDQGLRVQVFSARIVPAEDLGQARPPKLQGKVLLVQVRVSQEGQEPKSFPYESWADQAAAPSAHTPRLTDDTGRAYTQFFLDASKLPERPRPAAPGLVIPGSDEEKTPGGKPVPAPAKKGPRPSAPTAPPRGLGPGGILNMTLAYPAPPPEVTVLQLELPATAFGLEGRFRFRLPRAMIQES